MQRRPIPKKVPRPILQRDGTISRPAARKAVAAPVQLQRIVTHADDEKQEAENRRANPVPAAAPAPARVPFKDVLTPADIKRLEAERRQEQKIKDKEVIVTKQRLPNLRYADKYGDALDGLLDLKSQFAGIRPLTMCLRQRKKTGNKNGKIVEIKVRGRKRYQFKSICIECGAHKCTFLTNQKTGGRI